MSTIEYQNSHVYLKGDAGKPVFLSGGFGSEVKKIAKERNVALEDPLQKGSKFIAPLHAPGIVEEVHFSYANAGADILTADTFCANVARQNNDVALTGTFIIAATGLAKSASQQSRLNPLVALSLTASGDCYDPTDTPSNGTLIVQHKQDIALLSRQADLILVETIPTLREAEIIAALAQQAKEPFLVSFVVNDNGDVLDGSTMDDVVQTILKRNTYCMGVGVNCCSIKGAENAVGKLGQIFAGHSAYEGKHIIAYPNGYKNSLEENTKTANGNHHHAHEVLSPEEFTQVLGGLIEKGASVVGGCCGSTPEHTKAYSQLTLAPSFH